MAHYAYGGTLVYAGRDDDGPIEVVDDAGVRSLHFGTEPRQSALNLADPDRLELSYTRAMLAALLFQDSPERVLLIGLGGGSLARFLWRHYPQCHIDAVEKRAGVVQVARDWFGLPADPRLAVHVADGLDFVVAAAVDEPYDLILVDAYHGFGMAQELVQQAFYQHCAALLADQGVLSANLWGNDAPILAHGLQLLAANFAEPVLQLRVLGRGNVIGLGFHKAPGALLLKGLRRKAAELESKLGLEFGLFVKRLKRTNSRWLARF